LILLYSIFGEEVAPVDLTANWRFIRLMVWRVFINSSLLTQLFPKARIWTIS